MARFDVYPRPGTAGGGYVLDVQSNLLNDLSTRVVVPLLSQEIAPKPAQKLNPTFEIEGQPYVMLTQFVAAVPARELELQVVSVPARGDDIMRALDMLLVGF